MNCTDCKRPLAGSADEAICNTGACGCKVARSLCWRQWNNDRCEPLSPYDPDYTAAQKAPTGPGTHSVSRPDPAGAE